MPAHTAKTLFDKNIESANACVTLYDGIIALHTTLDSTWLLRAAIVFSVSALDAFFHDKVKYRVGHNKIDQLPKELKDFPITLDDINKWQAAAKRPGNFIRNVVVKH